MKLYEDVVQDRCNVVKMDNFFRSLLSMNCGLKLTILLHLKSLQISFA